MRQRMRCTGHERGEKEREEKRKWEMRMEYNCHANVLARTKAWIVSTLILCKRLDSNNKRWYIIASYRRHSSYVLLIYGASKWAHSKRHECHIKWEWVRARRKKHKNQQEQHACMWLRFGFIYTTLCVGCISHIFIFRLRKRPKRNKNV